MRNSITFGHLLTVMAILVLPLIGWGVSVETRFEGALENEEDIKENKKSIDDIKHKLDLKSESDNANFILVLEKLHAIELEVKDKKNRED